MEPRPPAPTPRVVIRRSARRTRTLSARREGDAIVVAVPARLDAGTEARLVAELVAKVLTKERRQRGGQGEQELLARAVALSRRHLRPQLGHTPTPARVAWVGTMATRWASCTPATGVIRLSERLQPMPSWVVDYVLLHELAHLVQPHHDERFWALLAGYPQLERARGFLDGFSAAAQLGLADDADDTDVTPEPDADAPAAP